MKEKQSVRLIEAALEEAKIPWKMNESALYYRLPQNPAGDFGKSFVSSLLSEIKNKEEYEFLREN